MTVRDVQAVLRRIAPNQWTVKRHASWKHIFILTRADSVELIPIATLVALASAFPHYEAAVTIERRSQFWEDGVDQAVWLTPKRT